ncbi:MAG: hypothetical protein A2017_21085 [Lentisphaerae bacterium GWF2_44_16]|nr:MAG: hypothetical protein A2017_21085 [Lentisphaerae bacterium GWF2_44_16]
MNDEFLVKSVAKAFNALDFILLESLRKKGSTLTEVAAHLGIQQTTARNILKTMEQCGYVSRLDGHLYAAGVKCYEMQRNTAISNGFLDFASQLLKEAAKKVGETFVLTSINNGKRIPLLQARGSEIINVEPSTAETQSVYKLVTTRIMLSYMDGKEIDFFIKQNGLPEGEWKNITTEQELHSALSELKKQGHAEEKLPQLMAFAVPFFGKGKILTGAIGAFLPLFRYNEEKRAMILEELTKTARSLNEFLEMKNFNN